MNLKSLALVFLFVTCAISEENDENNVEQEETDATIILTDENFSETLKDSQISYFIKFYAPW